MISALAELHFVRPQWLWALLPLLPASMWWWRRHRRSVDGWQQRVDPHLLPHVLESTAPRGAWVRGAILPMMAALAILALSGPGWRHQPQPLWQEAAPLVIALDLSRATSAEDLQPSRLLQARAAIDRLLDGRGSGQVGLVAFADGAHTVAPLTDDPGNVRIFLDALAPDIMPTGGSRPDRAIAWSAGLLRQSGFERGSILLLTHDADAASRRQAAAAAREGYTVSVLGLGTLEGGVYRDAGGRLARSRMDAQALAALAAAGSGRYLALAEQPAAAELAAMVQAAPGGGERAGRTGVRADQGYWLLLPLMVLAVLAFRRGALPMLALVMALGLPVAPAWGGEGGLWQRADQARHARGLEAVEAYRRGDFEAAAGIWGGLPGADAAYNRGNALARAGLLQEALQAYDQALAAEPGMADAIANREVVARALQERTPEGDGGAPSHRSDGEGGDGGDAATGDQGQPPPDRDSRGADVPGSEAGDGAEPQSGRSGTDIDAGGEPSTPADEEAQREADAALRQQIQRALDQEPGEDMAHDAAPAGDLRERERRAATEAWLRRIPDDPGGLLRARFRLEHERRRREGAD